MIHRSGVYHPEILLSCSSIFRVLCWVHCCVIDLCYLRDGATGIADRGPHDSVGLSEAEGEFLSDVPYIYLLILVQIHIHPFQYTFTPLEPPMAGHVALHTRMHKSSLCLATRGVSSPRR